MTATVDVVVVATVAGSDVDVNARRRTCRFHFYSTSYTRSAEHVGVADIFVRHAVYTGFYSTSWTFDGGRAKADMPFVLAVTAHPGPLA